MEGAQRPLRLVLELETAADPIRGVVIGPGEEPRPYMGWLGLISAIEDSRQARVEQVEVGP